MIGNFMPLKVQPPNFPPTSVNFPSKIWEGNQAEFTYFLPLQSRLLLLLDLNFRTRGLPDEGPTRAPCLP